MLKRLKLKSLLPSSALRSNSAALRLSKTPPQGGVFVSDASHFPGGGSRLTRATNTRRHHSGQPTQTPHLPVAPVSAAPPGNKRCQCRSLPQPPGHYSGQPTQTPPLPVAPLSAAPPGNKRCQCHSLQGITPGNQPKHRPLPVAPESAAPPGNKRCQCRSLPQPPGHHSGQPTQTPALTRSPGKHCATGEQTVPVPKTFPPVG
jgi:hypothetical protein